MLKQKYTLKRFYRVRAVTAALLLVVLVSGAAIVHADQYDAKINALNAQNATKQNVVDGLVSKADSYQGAIDALQNQIDSLDAAMAVNQNKQDQLEGQINTNKQQIKLKKSSLSDDIKTMYVDGQMSTIEELATSKNLSDYVDKEEYRTSVQNQLDDKIHEIGVLQMQLQKQKDQLDIVVNTEKQQDNQLATAQNQKQQLLGYNQSQQSAYNSQIHSNQKEIGVLQQEQIQANQRLVSTGGGVISSGSCGGGYPATAINGSGGHWGCDYPLDNTLDNWGMYNRECVSFTAWKVYQAYGYMPYWGGSGNANEWPGNARAAGIPIGSTPKVGSVAIYMGGSGDPFGHAMWVIGVHGGTITVEQYNLYYDGNYYVTNVSASGLTYIYFGG